MYIFPEINQRFSDFVVSLFILKNYWEPGGAWVAQLVRHPTSAQVRISRFMGLSPALGSVQTEQSLEPASHSVSPSLSTPPPLHTLSLKNKIKT